jgi:molybdopterin-binding protein
MAQVDIRRAFRIVSLMSREAVDDLDLQVGSVAAVIKSTTVVVERCPRDPSRQGATA